MLNVFQLWDLFARVRDECGPNPALACIVNQAIVELDPLLRGYFTGEIRDRVGISFDPAEVTTPRLYEILVRLQTCRGVDYPCLARLQIPEIDAALRVTLREGIQRIVGQAEDGTAFDERGITTPRLAEIHEAIKKTTADDLANSKLLAEFPEIEEVIRQRWLERTFNVLRQTLHANPYADITAPLAAYRAAIQVAFSVTLDKTGDAPYDWGLVAIHYARQALQATAKAFADWLVRQQDKLAPDDPRRDIRVSRFRLFRTIMGNMTFRNVEILAENAASSDMDVITIYQRPVLIKYYKYKKVIDGKEEETWRYVPYLNADKEQAPEPDGWAEAINKSIPLLAKYESGTYAVGNMVPAGRQWVMSPNNFIHELGHSLSRYAGFGTQQDGSIEQAMLDRQAVDEITFSHAGMGRPPYPGPEYYDLYYEHASVTDRDGVAQFDTAALGNKPPQPFAPSGYLLYDLFGDKYALWSNSSFTPYRTGRIDPFVQNNSSSVWEVAADGVLNWVRSSFDTTVVEGRRWLRFFDGSTQDEDPGTIGVFLRNAAFYQARSRIVSHYQSLGLIGEPFTGALPPDSKYNVRLTPEEPEKDKVTQHRNNKLGLATSYLSPKDAVPIYGWARPRKPISEGSPYWLLVFTSNQRLAWIASKGLTYDEAHRTSAKEVDPALLSPTRPFAVSDLDLFLQ